MSQSYFSELKAAIKKKEDKMAVANENYRDHRAKVQDRFCTNLMHFVDYRMQLLIDDIRTKDSIRLDQDEYPGLFNRGFQTRDVFLASPMACKDRIVAHVKEKYGANEVYYRPDSKTARSHSSANDICYFGLHVEPEKRIIHVYIGDTTND
jgi:hypothetical protein